LNCEEIELRLASYAPQIDRLVTISGIDRIAAWTIVAETGVDMSVFSDSRHLASWAALCPGNRESGGKRMSGKTCKGNSYLRRILCQAAWAATRKKDCHLAATLSPHSLPARASEGNPRRRPSTAYHHLPRAAR